MDVFEAIKHIEKSKEYSSWKKDYKKAYLAHCFKMNDKANENSWQIGYFNPDTHLISVFVLQDKTITRTPDAEVFKEQEKLVAELNLAEVKINENEAMDKGMEILNEEYTGVGIFKSFMILQSLENVGQVWNITFVTQQFKTVNVKIDANSGVCVSHKEVSLIKQEKEE
jgi:hypothetical protein